MKKGKPKLLIDFCSYKAAKYACEHWHYSKCMPVGKTVKFGVWEDREFKGVIIYSRGANKSLMSQIKLNQTEGCELTRIALNSHYWPVSKMLSVSLRLLKKTNNGLKAVISFADTEQNHHGGIYQATNWIYMGLTNSADEYLYKGKRWHGRAFRKSHGSHLNYLNKGLKIVKGARKHRYLMPLENRYYFEKKYKSDKKYPTRIKHKSNADSHHESEGGAAPPDALQ